ncbi:MAG: Crp/Fnr family transcriptional regulator [Bacteroidota bacterium]
MAKKTLKSRTLKVQKGEIIQYKGDTNSKIYLIKSGLLRSYSLDSKGKEHIFMFAIEGQSMGDATLPNEPCQLYIDALEDSELVVREKNIDKDAKPGTFKMLVECMVHLQERVIMLMSVSAIERYTHFEKNHPVLLQRLPQRMIAAYLGVTPEALSKIKGDRAKNKEA